MLSTYLQPKLLAIVILTSPLVAGNQKYLMCKTMEEVFSPSSDLGNQSHPTRLQGPPGKRGPIGRPGVRGQVGNPGPQGVVDYSVINETIDEKFEQVLTRIDVLEEKIHNISRATLAPRIKCEVFGGFLYDQGKCYQFYLLPATYDHAREVCSSHGSTLAEFEDRNQQIVVEDALREQLESGDPELWIGMKYVQSARKVEYSTGRRVNYDLFKWHAGQPNKSYRSIAVEVKKSDRNHGGLWERDPSGTEEGALCEKRM